MVSSEIVIFVALFNLIHISNMAKGNLFLGMGRGSVGDVTFYRANGQQLSRARNRSPRNPRSDAQLVQRAVSATISQAYKAGKVIFDHAFEGKSVPLGNQRRFLSVNMRALRDSVISQLYGESAASAAVVSPGSTYPVPNAYRISEGSLIQSLFTVSLVPSETPNLNSLRAELVAPNTGETLAEYAERLGLVSGEIFTLVGFGIDPTTYNPSADDLVSSPCRFGFMRLIVKEDAITSTTAMSAATYGDLFTIDGSGTTMPLTQALTLGISLDQVVPSSPLGSLGVIRSNENSGLRSTSDMLTNVGAGFASNEYGVQAPNLLVAWSQESGQIDSNLILEGGGF